MRRCSTDAAIIRAVKGKRVPCSEAEIIAQVTSYCARRFALQAQEVVRRLERLCADGFLAKVPAMGIVGYAFCLLLVLTLIYLSILIDTKVLLLPCSNI